MNLIKSEKAIEKLTEILLRNGFNSGFSTGSFEAYHHLKQISDKAKELDFELPPIEQRFFSLFHNLGAGDFDAAYLYDTHFNPVALNANPKLNEIKGLAVNLTKLLPANNLIIFYDNSRFAIPVISFYREGKLVRHSDNAGSEIYRPDYWKEDEKRIKERTNLDFESLLGLGIKSIS